MSQEEQETSKAIRLQQKYFIEGESVDAMVKRIEKEFMDNITNIFQQPKKLEAAQSTITEEENQTFSYGKLL